MLARLTRFPSCPPFALALILASGFGSRCRVCSPRFNLQSNRTRGSMLSTRCLTEEDSTFWLSVCLVFNRTASSCRLSAVKLILTALLCSLQCKQRKPCCSGVCVGRTSNKPVGRAHSVQAVGLLRLKPRLFLALLCLLLTDVVTL